VIGGGIIKSYRCFLALTLSLLGSGCFRYVPTELDIAPPGENVRLTVTSVGAAELNEIMELTAPIPILSGDLVRMDESVVLLSIPLAERRMGIHTEGLAQTIRIPVSEVLAAEKKELDPVRTALLASGTVGVAASVVFLIMESFGALTPLDDGNPIEHAMNRLFSFSIPIGLF